MGRTLEDIEATIAKLEEQREAEDAIEKRLLEATAGFYAGQERTEIAGLSSLLESGGIEADAIDKFFKAQEGVAEERVKEVTPQLQLTADEIQIFEREERAITLIDPCSWASHSPDAKCQWNAFSCNSWHWETANALGSCVCNTPNNECNPRVQAFGQGSNGWRSAYVHCWCYFYIPAHSAPGIKDVDVLMYVHGLYIVRSATGSATLSLELEAKAYQYGWSWASVTMPVLNLSGDTMGRYDGSKKLEFVMPAGADPFIVRVSAKLRATAKMGGAFSVGDFATGAGNFIKTVYVNTYDT